MITNTDSKKNSNTQSAATDFVNYVSINLDEKRVVVTVFIDIKKAFDIVDYDILMNKLELMGIRGKASELIKSYLTNRRQFVSIDKSSSTELIVNNGVPQRSVLGPLLYSLHVLSLKKGQLRAQYYTFADDTTLVYTHTSIKQLEKIINADLNKYKK